MFDQRYIVKGVECTTIASSGTLVHHAPGPMIVETLANQPMGSQGIGTKVHQGHDVYFYTVHLLIPPPSLRCGNAKNLRVDRSEI